MPSPDDRDKEPLHPAVLSALLDDERDRSGSLAHALERSRHRHRASIRMVAGVLLVAGLIALWRLLS
jgi:hypothetical protein